MRSLKNRVLQPNHTTVRDSSASGTRSPSLKEPSSPGRVAEPFARSIKQTIMITDVALEGTTESTRREAPGVAEREGPCAALCPGG